MSIYRGPYFSASGCDGSARPGTRAAMSWYLGAYEDRDAANLGTYACKRLGKGWSIHAERRAADMGTAPYGGVDSAWGWALANAFRLNSAELGIQLLILGDRIWSCTRPDAGWRPYGGAWHGHLHTEFIPDAADNLTAEHIERTLHEEDDMPSAEEIAQAVWRHEDGILGQDYGRMLRWVLNGARPDRAQTPGARVGITAELDEVSARQEAILAAASGDDVVEAVRDELARHRTKLTEVLDDFPERVAARVETALGDRDSAAVREAVAEVLREVRVEIGGDQDG